ncbi:LuxR C-terminal-related transcriptional regulator [Pseudomonas nitroreducens]|uniref:LuxR C-terminal-related transcriptional regulator n=1 Tax=Pseudomonas nitroreducens TaxID=46680 RepID=UPI001FB713DC|nr:LuxR C-terminal-related transcriptional regulator [Pseudomonas nitroreducens]MCJ1882314.1 LuxR C-terminal-related transcriptional regulator [Pseudomonas nitroreducens]MCJ1893395.1 LuxR C-terminal-related transcriptional regulator [Pseudomonas nitroreducens]
MASVLLLEALPAIRGYLRMELERMGHEVVGSVGDSQIGLEQIRRDRPDLVILDLSVPGRSGLDLVNRIRAHTPTCRLLVYTSLSAEHFAPLCLKAGVNGFVSKSEDLAVLWSSVRSVLNGRNHYPALSDLGLEKRALSELTQRELSVLQLIGEGKTNQAIADILSISFKTVSTHKGHLQQKLRVASRLELIEIARRYGMGQSAISDGYVSLDVPEQRDTEVGSLQAMLDAVGHPMFFRDRDGRLLLCNHNFLEFYQVTRDEAAGQGIQDAVWFEPDQRDLMDARYKELVATEQPGNFEHTAKVRGIERLLHIWSMPYRNDSGELLGMVGGVRDLTAQAQIMTVLREERRQTQLESEARFELFQLILLELSEALTSIRLRVGEKAVVPLTELLRRLADLVRLVRQDGRGIEEPCDVQCVTKEEFKRYHTSLEQDNSEAPKVWLDVATYRELLRACSSFLGMGANAVLRHKRSSKGLVEIRLSLTNPGDMPKFSITLLRKAELLAERLDACLERGSDGKSLFFTMELEEELSSAAKPSEPH